MNHFVYIFFIFALGACVGSFLNVVVWRLPRGESLVTPPSHCPKCNALLKWYDNIPILGWLKLGGRCRYCREPISPRYPIVEAVTGALLVLYFVLFFIFDVGPCRWHPSPMGEHTMRAAHAPLSIAEDWPIYALYMFTVCGLLAASLVDAEQFVIPVQIPWLIAAVGIVFHALLDHPTRAGALNLVDERGNPSALNAIAAGAAVGLLVSVVLWLADWVPTSFAEGEPLMDLDRDAAEAERQAARRAGREMAPLPPQYTSRQVRAEIGKEIVFLLPPMMLAVAWFLLTRIEPLRGWWDRIIDHDWATGLLGAVFGALVGGFVVWVTRILGTLGFGRLAMGLGDVHLMFGVGAVIGAGGATAAFFLAPFFGIAIAIYMLLTGTRRELPYGPYLSLGTAAVMLFYGPIADYLRPGMGGLVELIGGWAGAGG